MPSNYEKNLTLQLGLMREILARPAPDWLAALRKRRHIFVGIGTSYHAAQLSRWLWRKYVSSDAEAIPSFDFVRIPQDLRQDDVVVLFTHSGAKSFTLEAAKLAHASGATTIGLTRKDGPWKENLTYRLETCEKEDTGVHTKSFTTALSLIIQAIGDSSLTAEVLKACSDQLTAPAFPKIAAGADLILLGDAAREWVAREVSLKVQEAAYIRSRPFGIEEFLHGPRISAGPGSVAVCFTDKTEARWDSVRDYLRIVEVPMVEVEAEGAAGWLKQIFWGQRFTLKVCGRLGLDPDAMRTQDPRYKLARERLSL